MSMNYWILQSNPKYLRLLDRLGDFNWLADESLVDKTGRVILTITC
jgi:hypothetical protein